MLSEKADGEVSYQSVFDPNKVTKTSLPRVLDRPPVKDPAVAKGQEYVVKPDKTVRGVPKYSRRSKLGAAPGALRRAAGRPLEVLRDPHARRRDVRSRRISRPAQPPGPDLAAKRPGLLG